MVRPHQEILSSTTNGDYFYVAKLNKKLHDEILEVLESFGRIQNSQEFKFNYYHTTSDDTTEHEVKVISVAKGLLARLNPQDSIPKNKFPRNKWIYRNCDVLPLLKFCTNKPILASLQFFFWGGKGAFRPKKGVTLLPRDSTDF
jgi:hypothetical protein